MEVWRDAVAMDHSLSSTAKLILVGFTLPHFLDDESWIAEVLNEELADVLGIPKDEVRDEWETVTESPYVEPIGRSGRIFKLKFPEN
jgi:hypothetical protein